MLHIIYFIEIPNNSPFFLKCNYLHTSFSHLLIQLIFLCEFLFYTRFTKYVEP